MPMVGQPIDEIDSAIEVRWRHAVADHSNEDEEKLEKHEADDHQGEDARERAPGSAANQGSAPPGSNFKGRTFCSIRLHFSFLQHTTRCLYRLPKVISEMVGQTCRFAATTRRSSPTISEISFGNHSNSSTIQRAGSGRAKNCVFVVSTDDPQTRMLRTLPMSSNDPKPI